MSDNFRVTILYKYHSKRSTFGVHLKLLIRVGFHLSSEYSFINGSTRSPLHLCLERRDTDPACYRPDPTSHRPDPVKYHSFTGINFLFLLIIDRDGEKIEIINP